MSQREVRPGSIVIEVPQLLPLWALEQERYLERTWCRMGHLACRTGSLQPEISVLTTAQSSGDNSDFLVNSGGLNAFLPSKQEHTFLAKLLLHSVSQWSTHKQLLSGDTRTFF